MTSVNGATPTKHDDSLQSRMIRTARLDPTAYDEVKNDPAALRQAGVVVLLAAVATGIGFGQGDVKLIFLGALFALLGWYFTAYMSWLLGARLFREPGRDSPESPAQLLRTIGFASSPGLVRMLAVIPELRSLVVIATTVWMLFATVIAIRQGLGFESTGRAVGVFLAIQILLLPFVFLVMSQQAEAP